MGAEFPLSADQGCGIPHCGTADCGLWCGIPLHALRGLKKTERRQAEEKRAGCRQWRNDCPAGPGRLARARDIYVAAGERDLVNSRTAPSI
jgi:hypothetical protein